MEEILRCTDILGDTVKGYQGIDSVRLELAYDPRLLHAEAAQRSRWPSVWDVTPLRG